MSGCFWGNCSNQHRCRDVGTCVANLQAGGANFGKSDNELKGDGKPFVSGCCEGKRCGFEGCSAPAEHKVEEAIFHDDPMPHRHELTSYICHEHFRLIMGPAADRRA